MTLSTEDRICAQAKLLGASTVGIASAEPVEDFPRLLEWLRKGNAQNMHYMSEITRVEKRCEPKKLWPEVESILCVSFSYKPLKGAHPSKAKFGRYAWGEDYHVFVKKRLLQLLTWIQEHIDPECKGRVFVDTAPVLERSLARQAGVGWIGKNTCLISQGHGSYLYLGEIFLSIKLRESQHVSDHCGSCTACLDACPTDAFEKPYELTTEKCISYQTLENRRESIPDFMKHHTEQWVAGCDICQEVCPWNHKALVSQLPEIQAKDFVSLDSKQLMALDAQGFNHYFSGTSLERTGLSKLQDNAAHAASDSRSEPKKKSTVKRRASKPI
ncbi:MAG: tRNA epoxyqueuosine(34) reductase QueG [Bdellovibrionales bacterium]|nr:tRNA epoxyqueuosine(34) reductase QueG [Bdellovibrionales bacterium]